MDANKFCKVLVVDDDPTVCALLRTRLESEGYAVEDAENGIATPLRNWPATMKSASSSPTC